MSEQVAGQAVGGEQYLTFTIGSEEYGIEILKVQEIKGYSAITPIPSAPPYVRGVINLRGTIVPVIDLRARFGMTEEAYTKFTVIIVVNLGRRVVGLVVDAVSDVLNVGEEDVDPPPPLGVGVETAFMTGLAKMGERLVLLLDIEKVANLEEVAV
ncbi:MAG: chemotaxis protein CheW [Candidatus Eisenbacteria bacterium]